MARGLGRFSMSNAGGAESSSSMISLQRSMHSSQMYTPGPAISFLTCRCDLPQKLHRSCSLESVGLAISVYHSPLLLPAKAFAEQARHGRSERGVLCTR